jgi:hypothetical protein
MREKQKQTSCGNLCDKRGICLIRLPHFARSFVSSPLLFFLGGFGGISQWQILRPREIINSCTSLYWQLKTFIYMHVPGAKCQMRGGEMAIERREEFN